MVQWSPSVMGLKHRESAVKMRQLYPPFLQTEYQDLPDVQEITTEPPKIELVHRTRKRMSVSDVAEERFAEIGDRAPRDGKDYRWWGQEEFGEDETDRDEEKTRPVLLWPLDRCKTYSVRSKHELEPDTTDPYLSHELYASTRSL
ncbi:uncharacterized protein LOC117223622 isoform X3 [Megalopta genalis]|uniref:uncharacterized protein LOC117223622 isoform X3 n=1 Tax=Megalopta genalis TaxID=115081 RepID=UPI003FCFE1C9